MKRPSNRVIGLLAAGAVAAGGAGTYAVAASSGSEKSSAARLAEALNKNEGTKLTEADVQQAMQDAFKARLDEAVKAGRLTQAQADEMLQRYKDAPARRADREARRAAQIAPVAKLLGLTAEQIHEKRHDGVSLAELAKEKGIDRAKLIAVIVEGLKAKAAAGTTPSADELTKRAERLADAEGGRGFGPGRGHRGGPGAFGFGG